ncbi:hypothetical protein BABINDRAFT_158962 [Babjeviella inositovora NRRL Y-12698]|uniref:Pyruvate decarboxylase n=1 Tax=Babjeviella inositovora NRRL Y-12698 TaxID=984486 RepID=A0A1E3QXF0_9ASCO|nr:uncharacterized protein BABINDRAFT_158962 [Babjeviella inositovora NRRL Y-12698]ODQ82345.1 hypothetical protein BABINDRAFT_158962 [Babjeviella inositovora NRRL Y-12698]
MAPIATSDVSSHFQTTQGSGDLIPLGEYIFRRISQVGTKSIFGVPGDFNLNFLEHIYSVKGLNWIGCCNELNAGYAADGYAKLSLGKLMGVVVTTFGVGELSAINAISGSFAEYAPVLHIVGTSSMGQKQGPKNFHHLVTNKKLFAAPNHYVYENMVDDICIAKESIKELDQACEQVDRVLEAVYAKSRPGYLYLPSNYADMMVSLERLTKTPLRLALSPAANPQQVSDLAEQILGRMYDAERPAVLADILVSKFRSNETFNKLVEKLSTNVRLFSTTMSKGVVDESLPNWFGTYCGVQSCEGVARFMEECDFVLHAGIFDVETNNGSYTFNLNKVQVVELHPEYIAIGDQIYEGENMMQHVLEAMCKKLDVSQMQANTLPEPLLRKASSTTSKSLNQAYLVDALEAYLQPNDILVVETCSFLFAIADFKFKHNMTFVSQMFYGSIGYALPATLGCSLALRDMNQETSRRVVLIQGDGSAQMTIQELATYVRQDIKPTMFLLNNDGYSVERIIYGPNSSYNDIAPNWKWCEFFKVFGDINGDVAFTTKVSQKDDLDQLLNEKKFRSGLQLQLVELMLDRMDVPWRFELICGKQTSK